MEIYIVKWSTHYAHGEQEGGDVAAFDNAKAADELAFHLQNELKAEPVPEELLEIAKSRNVQYYVTSDTLYSSAAGWKTDNTDPPEQTGE